jgi:hypothetical protein
MSARQTIVAFVTALALMNAHATGLLFDPEGNLVGSYIEGNPESYSKAVAQAEGIIAAKNAARGIPVASPKSVTTTATVNAITTGAVTVAGGLTTAACSGGAGWWGLMACFAIGAVVSGFVQLGLSALASWLFSPSPSTSVATTTIASTSGLVQGQPAYVAYAIRSLHGRART